MATKRLDPMRVGTLKAKGQPQEAVEQPGNDSPHERPLVSRSGCDLRSDHAIILVEQLAGATEELQIAQIEVQEDEPIETRMFNAGFQRMPIARDRQVYDA